MANAATYGPAPVVDSISALTNRLPVTSQPVVQVLGDQGGWFRYTTNSFSLSGYGGTGKFFFPTNGVGYWTRIDDGPIDPRWWGAAPRHMTNGTMNPYGQILSASSIGTGDFSVWIRAEMPSNTNDWQGAYILTEGTNLNSFKSAFEFRIAGGFGGAFGFVFRATNGASAAGSTIVESSVLDASYSDFPALVGEVADIVVTRSGTTPKVFINGTDVTSTFTHSNPSGWAKSLSRGGTLGIQVGGNNNQWAWKQPIHRFAVFSRALTVGDMANLTNAANQVVSWAGVNFAAPPDTSWHINQALEFARATGLKIVDLCAGAWWTTNVIRLVPGVTIRGAGSPSHYPGHYSAETAPTDIVPAFHATHDVFCAEFNTALPDAFFDPVVTGMGTMYNRYHNSAVEGLRIYGALSTSSRGFFLDRVGSITIRDVQVDRLPGQAVMAMFGNAFEFENITGTTYGGIRMIFMNDTRVEGCFLDGFYGPGLAARSVSQSRFSENVFDVSFDQEDGGFYSRFGSFTANATTDLITKVNHRFKTGDTVWFEGDDLPAGLAEETDYFVYRVSDDTFKVNTEWVDIDSGGGAINGIATDITDAGSGTMNVKVAGYSVGLFFDNADRNMVSDTRSVFGWEGQVVVRDGRQNMFQNLDLVATGILPSGNNSATNISVFRIIDSNENKIDGGSFGQRNGVGQATYGINFEGASVSNQVTGVSLDAPTKWTGNTNNSVVPAAVFGSDGYVPMSPSVFDNADVRLRYKSPGTIYSENTTANGTVYEHHGPFANNILRFNSVGTASGEGARLSFGRSHSAAGAYGAVQQGDQIFELFGRGWYGTNAIEYIDGISGLEFYAADDFTITNTPTAMRIKLAPAGSTARQTFYDFTQNLMTAGGGILASNYVTAGGDITSGSIVWITNDAPRLILKELDAPTTNEVRWDARLVDGHWRLSLYNGSDVFVEDAIDIDRNEGNVTTFTLKGTSFLWNASPVWHSGNIDTNVLSNTNAILTWSTNLLSSINGGFPNSGSGHYHWSQLEGVPAEFADNTDDGGGGAETNLSTILIEGTETEDPNFTGTGGDVAPSVSSGTNVLMTVKTNTITSAKIVDATIATADIADSQITTAKIANGTILTEDIADSQITTGKIADGTIVTGDISNGTILGEDIAAATITGANILTNTIPLESITNITSSTLLGRGDSGDGSPEGITFDNAAENRAVISITGNALSVVVQTNDLAVLTEDNDFSGTNTFAKIITPLFEIENMSVTDTLDAENIELNGTNILDIINATIGSKTIARFLPIDYAPTTNTTGYATLMPGGRGDGHRLLQFDGSVSECAFFDGIIPEGADISDGISVTIWEVSTATGGTNVMSVAFERLEGLDIDGNSFGTATNLYITPSATSGIPTKSTVISTFTDSLNAEEAFRLQVCRLPGDAADSFTNHVGVLRIHLKSN